MSRAIVLRTPVTPALEADVDRAKAWLYAVGLECSRRADLHNARVDVLLDKVCVITECMELPGDMALRVRLFQGGDVFNLRA